jgi:hypothetical protein
MLGRFDSARNHWASGAMVTVAIGIVMIAGMGVQPPAAAQTDGTGRMCSNVTLRGDYGLAAVGQRAVPPFLGGGTEKFVATDGPLGTIFELGLSRMPLDKKGVPAAPTGYAMSIRARCDRDGIVSDEHWQRTAAADPP